MICFKCHKKLKCVDTRQISNVSRWRNYHCLECKLSYTSIEIIDVNPTKIRRMRRLNNASI